MRTRAELLAAAAIEFDTFGYRAATLDAVAERAKLTRGSSYYHFSSKADLARSLVEAAQERWDCMVADRRLQGYEGLEVAIFLMRDLAIDFRDDVSSRAAMRLIKDASHIEAELPMPFPGWVTTVHDLLVEARTLGQVRADLEVAETAWVIVASCLGVQEFGDLLGQRESICSRIDSVWLHLLPGLGVTDARSLVARVAAGS